MAKRSLAIFVLTALTFTIAFASSFRRSFLRIPETADVTLLPRLRLSSPVALFYRALFREPYQRACYQFVARTLLRSEAHLQVVAAFAALGLVAAAEGITSIRADKFFLLRQSPSADFLSIPFILGYCVILGSALHSRSQPTSTPTGSLNSGFLSTTGSPGRSSSRAISRPGFATRSPQRSFALQVPRSPLSEDEISASYRAAAH